MNSVRVILICGLGVSAFISQEYLAGVICVCTALICISIEDIGK